MTVRFRIDEVVLETTGGTVRYGFPSALTVLAGGVGVGKSTLFEAMKHALGGTALLAPVIQQNVQDVSVAISAGQARYRLVRAVGADASNTVRVFDLNTGRRLRDHRVTGEGPLVSDLLLSALGLPTDARAAGRSASTTRQGSRITFNDVFTFMYVPQSDIARDIAHSLDKYREPKRRAVFELLFGLTTYEDLAKRSRIAEVRGLLKGAQHDSELVQRFLVESGIESRMAAELGEITAREEEAAAEAELAALRVDAMPLDDRTSAALRDLLADAERAVTEASSVQAILQQQQTDLEKEVGRLRQDLAHLDRLRDAGERLAAIEFNVCPRCLQDVSHRLVEAHTCRLCLQPEHADSAAAYSNFEREQLQEQLGELVTQMEVGALQLAEVTASVEDREELIRRVGSQLDERTRDIVSPRLQAFADATIRLTEAQSRQRELTSILRQWDRASDLEQTADRYRTEIAGLKREMEDAEQRRAERRAELLDELNEEFMSTISSIGIPGVETAIIDPLSYLPVLNDHPFTRFSPPGGIRTATQVAYWVTLLTVALRRRDTSYPAFLLIDSPRTALNDSNRLTEALYRRLVMQADAGGDRVQIIIGDNELPQTYRRDYAQVDFTYASPTVGTIPHPGRDAVRPIYSSTDAETLADI